jgi:flavin reductase (DIM6/NTAB) family NADH-FMN oxidoreductase RutF
MGTAHSLSAVGVPLLHDVVARIECEMYSISDAGDHDLALGLVRALDVISDELPLLFHQGAYGGLAPKLQAINSENA